MQARAADLVAFDQGDAKPGARAVQRRCVPTGTATDHDHVEVIAVRLIHSALLSHETLSLTARVISES